MGKRPCEAHHERQERCFHSVVPAGSNNQSGQPGKQTHCKRHEFLLVSHRNILFLKPEKASQTTHSIYTSAGALGESILGRLAHTHSNFTSASHPRQLRTLAAAGTSGTVIAGLVGVWAHIAVLLPHRRRHCRGHLHVGGDAGPPTASH